MWVRGAGAVGFVGPGGAARWARRLARLVFWRWRGRFSVCARSL